MEGTRNVKICLNLQEFSTDECGKTYTCEKSPVGCTSSENCEALVMYKHDKQADTLDVVLSVKSGRAYLGWAQNDRIRDKKMVGRKYYVL